MNAVLDKRVYWTVASNGISLLIGSFGTLVPPDAILERWQVPGIWWEDGLDRRYYRVRLPDGRVGDFYENAHGQFLERWWPENGGESVGESA